MQHGKIKISFNAFEREPDKNAKDFSEAIGYTIRTVAELEGVSEWKQVPEENKNTCRKTLLVRTPYFYNFITLFICFN